MLSQEKKQSSRLVRLSIAGILLIVVVLAVGFSTKSTGSVGEKNMIVGVESDNVPETVEFDERNLDNMEKVDDMDVEDEDLGDEETEQVEDDIFKPKPKKVSLCQKICGKYFKNPLKKLLCMKDCKKYAGDSNNARKCLKDCKKACGKLVPKGKKRNCKISCYKQFCPKPLKRCFKMCVKVGKKHFKKPKGLFIGKCKKACIKNKKFRGKKCKKACMKSCNKFSKKGSKGLCKMDCLKLCYIL